MQKMPLVGRLRELDRVVSRLAAPGPAAFVIAGSAGVGKSRLAAEVADAVAGSGYSTEHLVATRAAGAIPFGAFRLPARARRRRRRHARPVAADERGGRERVESQAPAAPRRRRRPPPRRRLRHARPPAGADGLVQPDAERPQPRSGADAVTALWKDGLAERIHLDPLDEPDVRALAKGAVGGPVTGSAAHRSGDEAAATPSSARAARRGGGVRGGRRRAVGAPQPAAGAGAVGGLVDVPVGRPPSQTSEVLDLLALGEPLPLSLLEAVAAADSVEEAERAGLVVTVQRPGVEGGSAIPSTARCAASRWPALACAGSTQRPRGALGGRHRTRRRRPPPRPLEARRGGRQRSGSSGAPPAGAPALRRPPRVPSRRASLEAGGGVGAGLVLGKAELQSGRHAEAEQVLAGLVPQCTGDGERAAVANARSYNLGMLMGDHAAAEAVLDEALAALAEPAPRLRLLARRAVSSLSTGELGRALAAAVEVLDADAAVKAAEREAVNEPSTRRRSRSLSPAAATKRSPSPPPASTCTAAAATTPRPDADFLRGDRSRRRRPPRGRMRRWTALAPASRQATPRAPPPSHCSAGGRGIEAASSRRPRRCCARPPPWTGSCATRRHSAGARVA